MLKWDFNPILPWLLNTLQTGGGAYFTPLLIRLLFNLEALNLACRVLLVISFDFNLWNFVVWRHNDIISVFLSTKQPEG